MTTATAARVRIHETKARIVEAQASGAARILVITPGWGSSGYYPADVLKAAAQEGAIPAGTHMYLDHPTESEDMERPERSVRDLAAVTTSPAVWDEQAGGIVAEARVYATWRSAIADMSTDIGVSIRGVAEATDGEADGRTGKIMTRLVAVESVDFVTHAGRGGRILAIRESAQRIAEARNMGCHVEAAIHRDFTLMADHLFGDGRLTREERIALSSAIGDALGAFVARVEADAPQLYQRDPWDEPPEDGADGEMPADGMGDMDEAAAPGDEDAPGDEAMPEKKRAQCADTAPTNTPAAESASAGQPTREGGGHVADISDTELASLREAASKKPVHEARITELEKDLTEARAQVKSLGDNATRMVEAERTRDAAVAESRRLRAVIAAGPVIDTRLTESGLPAPLHARVRATVLGPEGRAVALTEAGALDTAALDAAITAAIDTERTVLAQLAAVEGAGVPRGLGVSESDQGDVTADLEREFAEAFGMSEAEARIAAGGR